MSKKVDHDEVWKPVKDFEGLYEVSKHGRIKSVERTRIGKHGGITPVRERVLKQHVDRFGYCRVTLYKDGKRHYLKSHRVVAMAFIPNADGKPEINHKDGNKTNNDVSNLEWNTALENRRHAYANGLNGGEHIKSRRAVNQYDKDNNLIAAFSSISEAEKKTGIRNIWMCCNFKYRSAGGYVWRYA